MAVVYLPTAKLPTLRLHNSFLPVLVSSSSILPADFDDAVALQAAEDDWDLLCVPADKTLNIGGTRSPVFDSNKLLHITSEQAYRVLHDIGRETKKVALKPITEQVKSVNAVTLYILSYAKNDQSPLTLSLVRFALMSIIMGFAFNTAFRPSTPTPTPTVNTPSSSSGHLWGIFCPLPNRSVVASSANTVPLKDMALSVFNPGMTALSVTPPSTSMGLSVASSSSKAVAEVTDISPVPSSSRKCKYCKSASDKPKALTDMVLCSESADGSGSNNIVFEDPTASTSSGEPKATTSNPRVIGSVSDVLDATSKAIENVGNEIAYLSEAADEFVSSLRMQRDNFVSQSKGKARALSEQFQNLNEEMVYRNERAKTRARKLKKRGEEILLNTREMLMKRTEKAKRRAKELGKSVLESDAWVTYQKVQEEMESHLSGGGGGDKKGQMGKQRKSKRGKENAKACRKESRLLLRSKRKVLTDEHCI